MDQGELPGCKVQCPHERLLCASGVSLFCLFRLHNSLEDRDISDLAKKATLDACAGCGFRLCIQVGIYVAGFPCKPYSPLRFRSRWLADTQAKQLFRASADFAVTGLLTCRPNNFF